MLSRPVPLTIALVLAVTGGLLLRTAFPAPGIWPFAFLGLCLILYALRGRSIWGSFAVGIAAGGALWGTLIFWLTLYLGPIPWLALCALMTLWVGLGCVAIALIYRWTENSQSGWMSFLVVPSLVAASWSARETLASSWPYGGFSWARLAYSQSQSPFGDSVSWVGVAGTSFLVAFLSAQVVAILVRPRRRPMIAATVTIVVVGLIPVFPSAVSGSMRLLVVQGNSDAGLFSQSSPGDILADHVNVTLGALEDQRARNIDAIVWPENASDIDPLRSKSVAKTLDAVGQRFSAPVITGTITSPREGEFFNSSLVWTPGVGATGQYDKMRPVPFAEYMPNRAFFRALVPDLVDLVSRDYSFGTRPNVVDINGVAAGISICFDITDSNLTRAMVRDGAEIILAQTNNADFGTTDENLQQLEIARIAAMESGRSVVNDSTVGQTAIIRADGSTQASIPPYEPGYIVADVALSDTVTPAMVVGESVEISLCVIALFGLVGLGLAATRPSLRARRLGVLARNSDAR